MLLAIEKHFWHCINPLLRNVLSCSSFPEGDGDEKAASLLASEEACYLITIYLLLQKHSDITLWSCFCKSAPLPDTCIG